jgi:UDP-N-acetylmuramyl pentapeptide phosphotransferase/UDP-N-acetylglucosamine-1-phosphate transferase
MLLYALLQVHLGSEDAPQYVFAATLTLPFLGATLGLLRHNW